MYFHSPFFWLLLKDMIHPYKEVNKGTRNRKMQRRREAPDHEGRETPNDSCVPVVEGNESSLPTEGRRSDFVERESTEYLLCQNVLRGDSDM